MTLTGLPVPAECDTCHSWFPSSLRVVTGMTARVYGSKAKPCPRCGGVGTIPDGSYTVMDRVLSQARLLDASLPDLLRMQAMVQEQLQRSTFDLDVLTAQARSEAPSVAPLLAVLRDPALAGVIGIVGVLLAIAALIVSMQGLSEQRDDHDRAPDNHQTEPSEGPRITGVRADGEAQRNDGDGH